MNFRARLVIADLSGKIKSAPAILTPKEKMLLGRYSRKVKVGAVEIGVLFGGSSSIITKFLPSGVKLTVIDPFIKDSRSNFKGNLDCARYFVEKYGDIRKIIFVKNYSYRVVQKWKKPIDFLFIDGNHDYDAIKADFCSWSPFLIQGGVLLIHDSNKPYFDNDRTNLNGFDGPTRVCNEIKKERRREFVLLESLDSMNVFQKIERGLEVKDKIKK
jgi:predicted O-methyltransferase YrrM